MSRILLVLSLFGISLLFVFGLVNPDSPVMWMASTSGNFAFLRLALIAVLVVLLVTHPPRNVYLRAAVGLMSTVLVSWGVSATYQNQMQLLDTLSILEVSLLAGLVVLEHDRDELIVKGKSKRAAAQA